MKTCSRCGNGKGGWWDQWPSYGRIQIGVSSKMGDHLKPLREKELTPRIIDVSQQSATIEWGDGYKISESDYGLCGSCQEDFVDNIVSFLSTKIKRK